MRGLRQNFSNTDRKSTRLNSSHTVTSYAVFCLTNKIVILGPNHNGQGAPLPLTKQDWQTPLGSATVDVDMYADLSKPPLHEDILAHRDEYSIEVQLSFRHSLHETVSFVPICMAFQEYEVAAEVDEFVAYALKGRDEVLIASSEFFFFGSPSPPDTSPLSLHDALPI